MKKVFFESNGNKLAAWLHIPEGKGPFPTVIRVHGYRGNKDGRTGQALAQGFKDKIYFRLDFHAHGESQGKEFDVLQCVYDIKNAINYVMKLDAADKDKIAVIGSSIGGLAAILACAWYKEIKAAVFICPVSDLLPLKNLEIKTSRLSEKVTDVYLEAGKISIPILIIHGDEDDIVPLSHSSRLAKHIKNCTLKVIAGANHTFDNETYFKDMIKQTTEFVNTNL